jgi:hypothetical protein
VNTPVKNGGFEPPYSIITVEPSIREKRGKKNLMELTFES